MTTYSSKNYSSSYVYTKNEENYEKPIMNAIMISNRIDKQSKEFADIVNSVKKRQITSVLVDVLMSDSIVLMINAKPLPAAFQVFTAPDVKEDKNVLKAFIDVTALMQFKNGFYECRNIDILVAYLISAMNQIIYFKDPRRILINNNLVTSSTDCFISMVSYVMDYLRISGYTKDKTKIQYMTAMYYMHGVLLKDITDNETAKNIAAKLVGITTREADVIEILYDADTDFENIDTFISKLVEVFKLKDFNTTIFIEKWIYLFGVGTQFAPELYVAFSTMLTNAYSGTYLNNQKSIEKCCGREMVNYCSTLFKIGQEAFNHR